MQARIVLVDVLAAAVTAQLQQRAMQPLEVALAPARGRNAQHAAVEVDQPAMPAGIEQDVVRVEIGMIQASAMEACDQLAGRLPRRTASGHLGVLGQRAHVFQPLHQQRSAITQAFAQVAGSQRTRHRQLAFDQFTHQPELGKTARAPRPFPQVAIAAHACGHAAAQVLPQHAMAEWRIHEPRAATPACIHRTRPVAPRLRRKQAGIGLPQPFAVEQNGAITATFAVRRQRFGGIERNHLSSLTTPWL